MSRGTRIVAVVGLAVGLLAGGPGCDKGDTITTPTLSATCAATPASGPAPLAVAFALSVAGAQGAPNILIDYGDGATGTNPDTTHTYTQAGLFTASFTVTTAEQSARCAATVTVSEGTSRAGEPEPAPGPEPTPPPVDGNFAPEAVFKTTPAVKGGSITGTAPFTVHYSMCPTSDPEGDTLFFTMDFDGDGTREVHGTTGGSCRRDATYTAGTWTSENCVTDLDAEGQPIHEDQCRQYTVVATP